MSTDWIRCKLGEMITLKRGYDLPEQERQPGPYPVVSSSGTIAYHAKSKVRGPGVVTGRYGTLGEVFFIDGDFWPLNTSLYVEDFKGNDKRFVSYFLRQLNLAAQNAAGAVPGVNRNHLHAIDIRVPPVDAQREIARVLVGYDRLIANNQRRIQVLERLVRGLFREWFVHFRFPGSEGVDLVQSPIGRIPNGWNVTSLGRVAVVNRNQISVRAAPQTLHYIDISSVSPGRIDSTTCYAFGEAPSRARRIVAHGDILWSTVRPNRRSHALVLNPRPNTIASTGFAVISAQSVPYVFLYQVVTTDEFVAYLTNHATGAAYPAVTAATFEQADLLAPPISLLDRFSELATPMAEQIDVLHRQIANLSATRDLLLPRLMSGRLTLPEAEDAVPVSL